MNRYGLKFILLLILLLPLAIGMTGCSRERNGEPKDAVSVAAEDYKKVELLNETAGELYRQTSEGNYPAARQSLASLADQMTGIEFVGITKVEGIRALSESIVSTKRIFNSVNFPQEEALAAAGRIRLITDALVHEKDPMWHQYYRLFKNDLDRMEAMTEQKKAAETAAALTQLEQRYLLVRPALFIRHDPSEIERLDSLFVFLKKQANPKQMAFPALQSGIKQLDELIDILFGKKEDRSAYLPLADDGQPLIWSFFLGALITSVLSYVAWRMFHSDKSLARVRKPRND